MNIRERKSQDQKDVDPSDQSVTNTLHLRDESEARQQLLERFGQNSSIIDFETSDHYDFAQSFQDEFRSHIR